MAEDTTRLEQAMQAAVQAGETETATRLAEEIRIRRANGGQQSQAVQPSAPAEVADPFENVPTEIGGVTLSNDLREAMQPLVPTLVPVTPKTGTNPSWAPSLPCFANCRQRNVPRSLQR